LIRESIVFYNLSLNSNEEYAMSKKIVIIHGSPRSNGNTLSVAKIAIQAAKKNKAEVFEIDATKIEYIVPGCVHCMQCQQSNEFICKIGDALSTTVATLVEYDVIVVATPVYWMSYPAQLKIFIDRLGALMKYTESGKILTPLAGKMFALIATGGAGLSNNLNLLERQLRSAATILSCEFASCLFPKAPVEAGVLGADSFEQKRAYEFGEHLASH
jgi:multimeric flavodoxin WrbA